MVPDLDSMPNPKVPGTFFVNRFYKVVFSVADPHPHSDSLVRGADTDPYQNVTDRNTGSVYAVVYNWVNLLLIR